jgi:hypothetical protein
MKIASSEAPSTTSGEVGDVEQVLVPLDREALPRQVEPAFGVVEAKQDHHENG